MGRYGEVWGADLGDAAVHLALLVEAVLEGRGLLELLLDLVRVRVRVRVRIRVRVRSFSLTVVLFDLSSLSEMSSVLFSRMLPGQG